MFPRRPAPFLCAAVLILLPTSDALSAKVLTKARATRTAYALAVRVGTAQGAVYAIAGFCKRRSTYRFNCWAGIVWADYSAAAQRVRVTMRRGHVSAVRFGRVYTGNLGGEPSGGESGGEWAICGIRQSVCIGS